MLLTVDAGELDIAIILDVEESIVALIAEVDEYTGTFAEADFLLRQNARATHGAFAVTQKGDLDVITFRENLEIENMDLNELDEAIKSVALMVATSITTLVELKGEA